MEASPPAAMLDRLYICFEDPTHPMYAEKFCTIATTKDWIWSSSATGLLTVQFKSRRHGDDRLPLKQIRNHMSDLMTQLRSSTVHGASAYNDAQVTLSSSTLGQLSEGATMTGLENFCGDIQYAIDSGVWQEQTLLFPKQLSVRSERRVYGVGLTCATSPFSCGRRSGIRPFGRRNPDASYEGSL